MQHRRQQHTASLPAWGLPARPEPRWPVQLSILATVALYLTLPGKLIYGPTWLMPVLVLGIFVPLTLPVSRRHLTEMRVVRELALVMLAVVSLANAGSLALLTHSLLLGSKATGSDLLVEAIKIWLTNVLVFALWYWELDRGGPIERSSPDHREPDFLFPQMTTPGCTLDYWSPTYVDYLYVAATNAMAFSPTDTLPLTPWAKLLMLAQSLTSLLTIALVAARAVNILH